MAVVPSLKDKLAITYANTRYQIWTLIASIAYSTWKRRPSGEKVLTPRSYSERVKNIVLVNISYKEKKRKYYINKLEKREDVDILIELLDNIIEELKRIYYNK